MDTIRSLPVSSGDMASPPLVYVVIPTFNAACWIEAAIGSVLTQTFRNYHIIVVDDGSTDDTQRRLQKYQSMPNLTYVRRPHQGVAAARNWGIQQAQGEYIAFLDADDLWLPHKLDGQIALMQSEPSLGLVCSAYEYIDALGNLTPATLDFASLAGTRDLFRPLLRRLFITTSSVVVRRSVCDTLGGFDEALHLAEDRHFFIRVARDYPIAVIPDVLVRYRRHAGNLTHEFGAPHFHWDLLVYERFRQGDMLLSPEERAEVEAFLVGRYRRMIRYYLRTGDKTTARRLLRDLYRLKPVEVLMALLPLLLLPTLVLRGLQQMRQSLRIIQAALL